MTRSLLICGAVALSLVSQFAAAAPSFPANTTLKYQGVTPEGEVCQAEVTTDSQARPFAVIVRVPSRPVGSLREVGVGFDYTQTINGAPVTTDSDGKLNVSSTTVSTDSVANYSATFTAEADQSVSAIEVSSEWVGVVTGTINCVQLVKQQN